MGVSNSITEKMVKSRMKIDQHRKHEMVDKLQQSWSWTPPHSHQTKISLLYSTHDQSRNNKRIKTQPSQQTHQFSKQNNELK